MDLESKQELAEFLEYYMEDAALMEAVPYTYHLKHAIGEEFNIK